MTVIQSAAAPTAQRIRPAEGAVGRTARVPKLVAWGTLMTVSEAVRFAGFMVVLVAMAVEKLAVTVISR